MMLDRLIRALGWASWLWRRLTASRQVKNVPVPLSLVERLSRPAHDDPATASGGGSSPAAPAKTSHQSDRQTSNDQEPSDPAITARDQELETSKPPSPPTSPSSEPATMTAANATDGDAPDRPMDDLSPAERLSRPAHDDPATASGGGSSPATPAKTGHQSDLQTPNDQKPSDPAIAARNHELETSKPPSLRASPSSEPVTMTAANAAEGDAPDRPTDDLSPAERLHRPAHDGPATASADGSSPAAPAKTGRQSDLQTPNDQKPSDPAIAARNQELETSKPPSPPASPSSAATMTAANAADGDTPDRPMDDLSPMEGLRRPAYEDPATASVDGSSSAAPEKTGHQSDVQTPNDQEPSDPAIAARDQEIVASEPPSPNVSTVQSDADHRSISRGRKDGATAPRAIGARRNPRRGRSDPLGSDAKDRPTLTPRPELICRKAAHQWEVALSADEECNVVEVRHDGEPLVLADGVCCLPALGGRLSIDFADGLPLGLSLFDGVSPLIFKLRNHWSGDGHRVRGITHGHFIVIAPKAWRRTGQAPVEPEVCVHAEFRAHYFVRHYGSDTYGVGGFEECNVELTTAGFELSGATVFDDAEDGDLFIGDVPVLRPASSVVWACIGEEREGGWKGENFKPADRSLADVLQGRQGRFFLRVYDATGKLLDSDEFRYCEDLQAIRVDDAPYTKSTLLVPPATGHLPTEVRFLGSDGATVVPTLTDGATHAAVGPGGIVRVDPHPRGDRVCCALESDAGRVDIIIKLPRIWWRKDAAQGEDEDGSWRDAPLMMTRQEFRSHSSADRPGAVQAPG